MNIKNSANDYQSWNIIDKAKETNLSLPIIGLFSLAFIFNITACTISGSLANWLSQHIGFLYDQTFELHLICSSCLAIIVFLWVNKIEKRPISSLGLQSFIRLKHTIEGGLFALLSLSLVVILMYLMGLLIFDCINLSFSNMLNVFILLPIWFIQGSSEEILVHGWLLPTIAGRSNAMVGLLLSTIFFVLMHYESQGVTLLTIINLALIGLLLGIHVLKNNSIWGAITFHTIWNFSESSVFGFINENVSENYQIITTEVSGDPILSGGNFGPEGSLITTFTILPFCIYIGWLCYINRSYTQFSRNKWD